MKGRENLIKGGRRNQRKGNREDLGLFLNVLIMKIVNWLLFTRKLVKKIDRLSSLRTTQSFLRGKKVHKLERYLFFV